METPDAAAAAAVPDVLERRRRHARRRPGHARRQQPVRAIAVAQAFPPTSPQSERTEELVRHLRDDVLPAAADGSGLDAHVGGQTASDVDFAELLSARLPWFIGAVLLLSFLLLMAVFRSVLVPLKAVVMNLLSIGAAYGVMVAVFQWGWLGSVFGVDGGGADRAVGADDAVRHRVRPVDGLRGVPAVVGQGGLRRAPATTADAVVEGLASTARVITAAAAIMVCVFGSFVVG